LLALARLRLAPREVRAQRRPEPLLILVFPPVGHAAIWGEAAG
jgi:hypothetical protein